MVDDPSRLSPAARAKLDVFRDAVGPTPSDTDDAFRRLLASAAQEGLAAPREGWHRYGVRRRWPWVAAAILFLGVSGLAAASVLEGDRLEPATRSVHRAAMAASMLEAPPNRAGVGPARDEALHRVPLAPAERTPPADDDDASSSVRAPVAERTASATRRVEPAPRDHGADTERPSPPGTTAGANVEAESGLVPESDRPRDAGTQLAEERALLAHAQRAAARGDFDRALSYTSRHAARFADGALAPERRTIQAIALCESGDVAAGREVIAQLRTTSPRHPGVARAERSCE